MPADLPTFYRYPSWHELKTAHRTFDVRAALAAVAATAGGKVPNALDGEAALRAFADAAGLRLAEADLEDAVFHPHAVFASRPWVRNLYVEFRAWCVANGWVTDPNPAPRPESPAAGSYPPVVPPMPPEVPVLPEPKKKRPAKQPGPVAA